MPLTPTLVVEKELSFEQWQVLFDLNRYSENDAIIIGGPGTGKSILAAHRAVAVTENKGNKLLLTYNVPVREYINHIIQKTFAKCEVKTYLSWLGSFYYANKDIFRKDGYPSIGKYSPDWEIIKKDFLKFNKIMGTPVFTEAIVDEAQDVPVELIGCLKLISRRVVCFIDPAQTVQFNRTTVKDLKAVLSNPKESKLKDNYRNTKEIAEAAAIFSSGNASYSLKKGNGPVTKPVMWDCNGNIDLAIKNMADVIRKHYKSKSIGIIVSALPDEKIKYLLMDKYRDLLNSELGKDYSIQCYKQGGKGNLDFGKRGVKIFTYATDKGIDFDIVLLPIVDPIISYKKSDVDRNRVYVALTRGREECYLFYGNNVKSQYPYRIFDILPLIKEHKSKYDWWAAADTFEEKYK